MNSKLMLYDSNISGLSGLFLYENHIKQNTQYPLHWHDYFEFEIIVSGRGMHTYNNTACEVSEGSSYIMSYCDFHSFTALTDVTLYGIHFDETILDKRLFDFLSTGFGKLHCKFEGAEFERIIKLIKRLKDETENNQVYHDIMLKNIISDIIIETIRKSSSVEDGRIPSAVSKAILLIKSNFRIQLTLDKLAKQLSFSTNHLGLLLKQWTGMSFNEYLNTLRLKYACNLLLTSDMSVKEIGFESGYNSTEYFLYVFKKKFMITPGEFRAQNKHTHKAVEYDVHSH